MKSKPFIGILLLLTGSTTFAQQHFTIKGNLSKLTEDVKVMLSYRDNSTYKNDSTIAKKGVFTFSGTITEPTRATLLVKSLQPDTTPMTYEKYIAQDQKDLFLENSVITITGSSAVKTATIKGGKTQTDFLSLQAVLKPYEDKMSPLNKQLRQLAKQKEEKGADSLRNQISAIRKDMTNAEEEFIRKHNNSFVSLDLMHGRSYVIELDKFEPLFNVLSANIKNSATGKKLQGRLDLAKKNQYRQPGYRVYATNHRRQTFFVIITQRQICVARFLGQLVWALS